MNVMTESRREIFARAASDTISRQQHFKDDNIGDRVYLPVSDTYNYYTGGIFYCME